MASAAAEYPDESFSTMCVSPHHSLVRPIVNFGTTVKEERSHGNIFETVSRDFHACQLLHFLNPEMIVFL
jgi:hypothetical protein